MTITLKSDVEAYLKGQVSAGRFDSIEAAIEALVRSDEVTQAEDEDEDLSWAKSAIDEGLVDVAAGRVLPAGTVYAELRSRLRTTK